MAKTPPSPRPEYTAPPPVVADISGIYVRLPIPPEALEAFAAGAAQGEQLGQLAVRVGSELAQILARARVEADRLRAAATPPSTGRAVQARARRPKSRRGRP